MCLEDIKYHSHFNTELHYCTRLIRTSYRKCTKGPVRQLKRHIKIMWTHMTDQTL